MRIIRSLLVYIILFLIVVYPIITLFFYNFILPMFGIIVILCIISSILFNFGGGLKEFKECIGFTSNNRQ